jgi:N-acetylglucosamine malate deacetylase 2
MSFSSVSSILLAAILAIGPLHAQPPIKVLAVVAHPDDEYAFAATTYRIARELGGTVDQLVISNGEAGYRYSILAEQIYGLHLTDEHVGRSNLPEIRKQESLAAGHILGIRRHYFLDQIDGGYTLDSAVALSSWDVKTIRATLDKLLQQGGYQYVFTLLPAEDTHGHHKAATLVALQAIAALPADRRPVVFGVDACASQDHAREFHELSGEPLTRVGGDVYSFRRSQAFGFRDALNYEIIADWVIAAHKSQGLLQMDAGHHDLERFWRFEISGGGSQGLANRLFEALAPSKHAGGVR